MTDDLFRSSDLDDLIHEAMRDPDRTVELTLTDDYPYRYGHGYQIEIDGVPFPGDDGLARETFGWMLEDFRFDDDQHDLATELLRQRKSRFARNALERARTRTETHRLVEGIEL